MWREGYVMGGDTRFFIRALGHGDGLVVLLHGWPEDGSMWRRVAPRLVDAGYRVACPDLKGFGRSDAPRHGYDPETLGDEISQLIRNLHVPRAALVGHDWGGAVALATAFRHPGRVRAVAVASAPYRHLDLTRAWHIPLLNLPLLPELIARHAAEGVVRGVFRLGSRITGWQTDAVVAAYAQAISANPHGWLSYYRRLSRRAIWDGAFRAVRRRVPILRDPSSPPRLRVPALVLWGEDDPATPLELGRGVAGDLDAELVTFPGIGHFVPEEAPDRFADALLAFIGPAGVDDPTASSSEA